ncbi:MAG: hypothetical protein COA33_003200 [Fluviicola sp.]|nr:hypothetical protein [Fluviicola sp.]
MAVIKKRLDLCVVLNIGVKKEEVKKLRIRKFFFEKGRSPINSRDNRIQNRLN